MEITSVILLTIWSLSVVVIMCQNSEILRLLNVFCENQLFLQRYVKSIISHEYKLLLHT